MLSKNVTASSCHSFGAFQHSIFTKLSRVFGVRLMPTPLLQALTVTSRSMSLLAGAM